MARVLTRILLVAALSVATLSAAPVAASSVDTPAPDPGGNAFERVSPATLGKAFGFDSTVSQWDSGVSAAEVIDLIRRAGGTMVRAGISWANAQPTPSTPLPAEGQLPTDELYRLAVASGVTPIMGILDAPSWAAHAKTCGFLKLACRTSNVQVPTAAHLADYAAFVRAIAERYPAAAIQTWNEPETTYFWGGRRPSADHMAEMQCAAYDAVKRVHPHQIVTSPGMGTALKPTHGVTYAAYSVRLYQAMAPRQCWDVLSLHIYSGVGGYVGDGTHLALAMLTVRVLRVLAGDTSPIWVTETGGTTTDRYHISSADQYKLQTEQVQKLLTMPDVGAVLIYSLRDGDSPGMQPTSPGYGYGILGGDLSPKPAYCYWVRLAGNTYPGC